MSNNKFEDQLKAKPKEAINTLVPEKKPTIDSNDAPVLEEVEEAFKEYFEQLSRDKIDDRAVRTTIHVDKDISEKLNDICYRKQGLKTKIVNYALRAFLKDGRAIEIAKEYDKLRKHKSSYDKKYYDKIIKKIDKSEG